MKMMKIQVVVIAALLLLVQAQTEDHDETVINARQKRKFRDCVDVRVNGGYKESGLFHIYLNSSTPIKAMCLFELNNTFTSIMGQKDGSVSFKRTWIDYHNGFGNPATGNFWHGLNYIKQLTDAGHVNMRITLQDWTHTIYEIYYKFSLHGPYFNAYISQYQGPLIDDFSYNNGQPFSTMDNDLSGCANKMYGGWWYTHVSSKTCTYTLPTGHYYLNGYYNPGPYPNGIYYKDWKGRNYSLKYIRIDLAPNP